MEAITPTSTINVSSTRVAGEWKATATIGTQVVAWCQSKSKKYAEMEARKDAEQHLQQQRQLNRGTALLLEGLKPFLSSSKAA